MTPRRGFGLLEMAVFLGFSALLWVICLNVLLPLLAEVQRGYREMDLSRASVSLQELVGRDLARTSRTASNLAGPDAWLLRVLTGSLTTEARPLWSQTVVLYEWRPQERRLVRRLCTPGAGSPGFLTDPTRPELPALAALRALPSQDQVASQDLVRFSLQSTPGGARLEAEWEVRVPGRVQPTRLRLSRLLAVRN